MKGRELRRHLEAADRHEHAALSHDRAADFWAGHDDDARAALQRELAEHERRGAQLERRWAELVDGPAAASDQPPPPRARAGAQRTT